MSRHLNARQLGGLRKTGDCLLPGDPELPSFSDSGCERHIDRVLDHMPAGDLGDLKTLLTILGFLPLFLVAWLLRLLESSVTFPGALGGLLRLIRLGLRGIVMSLYYGDPEVMKKLEYQVSVYTADLEG